MRVLEFVTGHAQWPNHLQRPVPLLDKEGKTVEKAMAVFHPGPKSYTGEDLAEISCHGNPLLVDRVMAIIRETGLARIAAKGEFTRRAYLNGKMDLAQAEAVGALIDAGSEAGIEMAKGLLSGGLSRDIADLAGGVREILSRIEASFILEDVETDLPSLAESLEPLLQQLDSLLEGASGASRLYSGIVTTIAGLPNAGKSSLFNAILGYPRAIVHHEGGTTRDILREHLVVSGTDFIFHDTAGIRETSSGPEEIGIQNTMDILKRSHLVLYVADAAKGLNPREEQWLSMGEKTILVMNKADLVEERARETGSRDAVWVSAKYGKGMNELFSAMASLFPQDLPRVFLERHAYLLSRARESLAACLGSAQEGMTPDALAIDLGAALSCLGEVIGENAGEDVIDRIFSQFCVGK